MPVPKRKRSRARRDSKNANMGITRTAPILCQTCQAATPSHQVCRECGYYKGIKVLRTKEDRRHSRQQIAHERAAKQPGQEAAPQDVSQG